MPTTLQIFAHHGQPPTSLTSGSLTYPGWPPSQTSSPWPPGPTVVWAELARATDVASAGWGPPVWPGPPPPQADAGFLDTASGFSVTEVAIVLPGISVNPYRYSVYAPNGAFVGSVIPIPPQPFYPVLAPGGGPISPIPDGKGIWLITIEPAPGTVAGPGPALATSTNAVHEPYVEPIGGREGVLALQLTGDPFTCLSPTALSIGIEVADLATGVFQSRPDLTGSDYVEPGQQIRLTAILPAGAPPATYTWSTSGTTMPASLPSLSPVVFSFTQPGTYSVTLIGQFAGSTCPPVWASIPVEVRIPCASVTVRLPHPIQTVTGCAPSGNPAVTLQCTPNWGGFPVPSSVTVSWGINGPTGHFTATTQNAYQTDSSANWQKIDSNGNLVGAPGPLDLSQPGTYDVSVSLSSPDLAGNCSITDASSFTIPACVTCPSVSVNTNVTGCAPTGNPSVGLVAVLTGGTVASPVTWTITSPSGRSATGTGLAVQSTSGWTGSLAPSGALDLSTPGTYQVVVQVATCPPTATTFVIPGCPATVASCSATAGSPGVITVTFSTDVNPGDATNPANYTITVNGAAPSGTPTFSYSPNTTTIGGLTIPAGATVSVTVSNVRSSSGTPMTGSSSCTTTASGSPPINLSCLVFLLIILGLGIIACVLGIIAACIRNPYLGIAAGIIGFIALVLLIIWLIVCARFDCRLFNWARWIVIWILMAAPVVALIVWLFVGFPCALLTLAILWAYWGVVLAILDVAGPKIGCPLVPPPWP